MALDWPDFSEASITDAAPLDALGVAVAERAAAASAGTGSHVTTDFPPASYSSDPVLSRLVALRNALRALAPRFVRLEDDRYKWEAWSRFPIAYSGDNLMKGEHSLAVLPMPGAPERSAESLEIYRTFLANCAWWIEQFRYVNVSDRSYFTRESTTNETWSYSLWPDGSETTSGTEPEDAMANPSHEDIASRGRTPSNRNMIDVDHTEFERFVDSFSRDNGWQEDTEHYITRKVVATSYSGLVVRNFSGLAGELLIVPCYTKASSRPAKSFPQCEIDCEFVDDIMPDDLDEDDGYRIAKDIRWVQATAFKHRDDWLETYRQTDLVHQWLERTSPTTVELKHEGTTTKTTTVWSLDGERNISTTETEGCDGYGRSLQELTEKHIFDFDGCGVWTLGVPVSFGSVSAHDRIVAISEKDRIPFPDVWDLEGFRQWRKTLHPRDRIDEVQYTAALRVVPVLDFNASYLYQQHADD